MAKKKKTKPTQQQLKDINKAVEDAGILQLIKRKTDENYEDKRKEVVKLICECYGEPTPEEGRTVLARNYEAQFCYDMEDRISANEFIEKVTDPMVRFLCLRVILKDAVRVLGRTNYRLLKSLITPTVKEEPTLHISPRR